MSYRRVVITEHGGPNVLKVVEEANLPEPGRGEVRVRVEATGANFSDVMVRKGMYPGTGKPPFSPGYDMVGLVDALGEGVTAPAVGQRVADLTRTGAYAEYLCLTAERLVPVPGDLDPAEVVALVLSYVTAYQMLHRLARVAEGSRILVHGAAGAVGTALLQLGALAGLEMYGCDSHDKLHLVEACGATPIDYRGEDFVARINTDTDDGVDAVFDPIGGEHLTRSWKTLRRGGTLVGFGFYDAVLDYRGGRAIPVDLLQLWLWRVLPNGRSAHLYSIERWRRQHPEWFRTDLGELFRLLAEGRIRPAIEKRMPLVEALHAHELLEQGDIQGRIILVADDRWRGDLSLTFGGPVPKQSHT